MGRFLINDVKYGISEGGFACGPVDGAVNVSVQVKDGDKAFWLSNSEFDGIPNFYLSEDSIFDELQSLDDDAIEKLEEAQIDVFEGIDLGEYEVIFASIQNNEGNPAVALVRYVILLTRCSIEDMDKNVAMAKGKYVDDLDIPSSDVEVTP